MTYSDPNSPENDLNKPINTDWYIQIQLDSPDSKLVESDNNTTILAMALGETSLDPSLVTAYRTLNEDDEPCIRITLPVILHPKYQEAIRSAMYELFQALDSEKLTYDLEQFTEARIVPLQKLGSSRGDVAWIAMHPVNKRVIEAACRGAQKDISKKQQSSI